MKLNRRKLAEEIAKRLASGEPTANLSREVAAYLVDAGKTSELNSLLRDVAVIRAEQNGIIELTAESAFALSPEQSSQIENLAKKQYPQAKQVIIHNQQNPEVIGGVSLSMPSASLDLSIRGKLNKLRTLTDV